MVLELSDVEAHAHRVLTDAHDRATNAVEEAERLARHLTANADHKGYADGHARGMAEGRAEGMRAGREEALQQTRAETQELTQRWLAAIEQWEARRERLHADAREDVLRFAFALGERIVHRLVRVDPTIVRDQMTAALKLLSRPSALQISVHPDDRGVIEEVLPEVKTALGRSAHVHLHDDPAIERGGCVLGTACGYVDASIETQLDRLAEALLRNGRLIMQQGRPRSDAEASALSTQEAP
jgi:flagellar assembly protein FliH